MALNFTQALMEAKRRAQLLGRPLSQQEASGIAEGYAEQASDRLAKAKALAIQEGNLALSREGLTQNESQFQRNLDLQKEQQEDAKKAATMQTVGNLGTTAATLYAIKGMSAPAATVGAETVTPAATAINSVGGGATATGASGASGAGATGAGTTATGVSSIGGTALTVAPYAVGGYLAAKYGGQGVEKMAGEGSKNVVSQFGRTIQQPYEGIGRPWVDELVKDESTRDTIHDTMNVLDPGGFVINKVVEATGTVICSELYRQGLMDDETYQKDAEFGRKQDLETMVGYHSFGVPLAAAMRKSKLITWMVRPFALAWAENMAGGNNLLGAFLNKIGVPICRMIGRFKLIAAEVQ